MRRPDPLLKTQQVAAALGVSVSTIKRWVDRGELEANRTVGRHRLVRLSSALSFARKQGLPLTLLEGLRGSPESSVEAGETGADDRGRDALAAALERGDGRRARALLHGAYDAGVGAVALADDLIRPVFERIGHGWWSGVLEVYQEHEATLIVSSALVELNLRPRENRVGRVHLALGATAAGDPYSLPLHLGELCLREAGWDVRNLGVGLPFASLTAACLELRPRLVFLCANALDDPERFVNETPTFLRTAAAAGVRVILGGRALGPDLKARLGPARFGSRMAALAEFALEVQGPDPEPGPAQDGGAPGPSLPWNG